MRGVHPGHLGALMRAHRAEKRHIATTIDNGRRRRGNDEKARGQQGITIRRCEQNGQESGQRKHFGQQRPKADAPSDPYPENNR